MKSATHLVALYLQSKNIGVIGQNIFIDSEPPTPNETLTIYSTVSDRPRLFGGIENTGYRSQRFGVQVRVRHSNSIQAHEWLQQARVALHLLNQFSDVGYEMTQNATGAWNQNAGLSLGLDANNRIRIVDNWQVLVCWTLTEWQDARITEAELLRITENGDVRVVEDGVPTEDLSGVWQEVTILPQWIDGYDGLAWGWLPRGYDNRQTNPCLGGSNPQIGSLIDDSGWSWGEVLGAVIRPQTQSGVKTWRLVQFIVRSAETYIFDANNSNSRVEIYGSVQAASNSSQGSSSVRRCGDIVSILQGINPPARLADMNTLAPTTFRIRPYKHR